MKTPVGKPLLLTAATSIVSLMLLPPPAVAEPEETARIEARLEQYEARFNQGDAEAVSQLFSEDVVYYDPTGGVHEGRQAVRAYYQGNMNAGFSDLTVKIIELDVAGNTAHDIARYTISGPNGEALSGYHLALLAKQDGVWRVERTLVNAVMPAPLEQQDSQEQTR